VACNVVDGIVSRNLAALHGYMADPFTIGYWGSEGRSDSPAGITPELAQNRLPADPASPMTFTTERAFFPPLAGLAPEEMLGPEVDAVMIIYSEGWGEDGSGAALLLIAREDSGEYCWQGMVCSEGHFDK
jgi:hypothetical protein